MAEAAGDLLALWGQSGVPLSTQKLLTEAGFSTLAKFAQLEGSRDEVRETAFRDLGFAGEGLRGKAKVAAIIDAWEEAVQISKVRREEAAVAKQTRQPVMLVRNEHIVMRLSFETEYYKLEDKFVPASTYVEKKFQGITEGDYRAETLQEVFAYSDEQESGDMDHIMYDPKGGLRLRRATPKDVKLPRDSEELRTRIRLMMVADLYAKRRFPNRAWLQDLVPGVYDRHVDYMLGEDVALLVATNAEGKEIARPTWSLVLSYEFQVRKKAYKFISTMEMPSLGAAFEAARKDHTIRERHFLTPMQLGDKTSPSAAPYSNASPRRATRKETRNRSRSRQRGGMGKFGNKGMNIPRGSRAGQGGKGKKPKNKGAGKGKFPKLPQGLDGLPRKHATSAGEAICFAFNQPSESCTGCDRAHVCWWCEKTHPGHTCATYREKARGAKTGDRR